MAQLGARVTGSHEVTGSIPVSSTKLAYENRRFLVPPEWAARGSGSFLYGDSALEVGVRGLDWIPPAC